VRPILIVLGLLLTVAAGDAQRAQLRAAGLTGEVLVSVGDTLQVDIIADVGQLRASGLALNLLLPAGLHLADPAARPFVPDWFVDGVEFANELVDPLQVFGQPGDATLLTYAVVLGPASDRYRSGAGRVASLRLAVDAPVDGSIELIDTPAHQSMVVLDDGRTELDIQAGPALRVASRTPAGKRGDASWGRLKASLR
jgi:hypothetical protein